MNRSLGDFAQLQAGSPSGGERRRERGMGVVGKFPIHTLAWPGLEVLPQELEKGAGGFTNKNVPKYLSRVFWEKGIAS